MDDEYIYEEEKENIDEGVVHRVDVNEDCYVYIAGKRIKVNGRIPYEVVKTLTREHGIKTFVVLSEKDHRYLTPSDFPVHESIIIQQYDTPA